MKRYATAFPLFTALLLFFAASPALGQVQPGDLTITEYMADPDDVSDSDGEYFELYNDTASDIDLNGYTFADASANTFTVSGGPTVQSGDFVVLCVNDTQSENGGVPCDYDYPNSFSLNQSNESVTVTNGGGTTVFELSYADGDNFDNGVAHELVDFQNGRDGTAVGPTAGNDYQAAVNNIDGTGNDLGSPGMQGTTLPVAFAGAPQATVNGRDVTLHWRTLSETNNLGFYVQHQRADETGWTTALQRVDGAGNSTSAHAYRYTVTDLAPGRYVFRVMQEDTDGDKSFSQDVNAVVRAGGFALQAPSQNPFQGRTVLRYAAPNGQNVEAALYNSLGQKVRTLDASTYRIEVRAEGLASGLYFVRLKAGERTATQSITLVR